MTPIYPECRDGKPWNCTGWALTEEDEMTECTTTTTRTGNRDA